MTTKAQIEAALGGHNHVFKNGRCIACDLTEKQINAITAAAEVGDDPYKDVPQHLWDMLANNKNATIERCAQVAESYANDAFHGEMIAAQIRALKDS